VMTTDAAAPDAADATSRLATIPPAIAGDVGQVFVPVTLGPTGAALRTEREVGATVEILGQSLVYRPAVLASGAVDFFHRPSGGQDRQEFTCAGHPDASGAIRWDEAEMLPEPVPADAVPEEGAVFAPLPESMNQARELTAAKRDLADFLYRSRRITLFEASELDAYSRPGESAADFRIRLAQDARERRDGEIDHVEERYETKLDRLEERIRKARATLGRYETDATAKQRETIVSIGESVLGALLGRRSSRAASSSLRRMRASGAAKQRAEDAEDNLEKLQADAAELDAELEAEVEKITARWEGSTLELDEVAVAPRRTDVHVATIAIGWLPHVCLTYEIVGERAERELAAY